MSESGLALGCRCVQFRHPCRRSGSQGNDAQHPCHTTIGQEGSVVTCVSNVIFVLVLCLCMIRTTNFQYRNIRSGLGRLGYVENGGGINSQRGHRCVLVQVQQPCCACSANLHLPLAKERKTMGRALPNAVTIKHLVIPFI